MRDSFLAFYTTAHKIRIFAYAVFAIIASCYIAINSLWLHRPERDVSYEVSALLALMVATAPVAYHFIIQEKEKRKIVEKLTAVGEKTADELEEFIQADRQKMRLLLAEDEETTRRLRVLLKSERWEIIEASKAQEILEKAFSLKPDLVLLDIQMPEFDGLELTREITSKLANTKVILLGAEDSQLFETEAHRAGAKGYMSKYYPLRIQTAVKDVFEARQERNQTDKIA